ncbi:MAG: hypothetical protein F4Z90_00350 [Acidimicrobiaceae bacterium]|nr:hypothetical protein [Acidimicrobiaceae bacterium]MYB86651.1 hypothetical protein [Acidimicrobiaceae bacterium]
MTDQLVLIDIVPSAKADSPSSWQLDPATCDIGRRGVARARQALQAARNQAKTATVPSPNLPAAA